VRVPAGPRPALGLDFPAHRPTFSQTLAMQPVASER
jgi:hypothetical protein